MNKMIKFKAKDKETGKWVFGFVKYASSGNAYIDSPLSDGGWDNWQVEPDTVCQFVGVSHGKEIYEKDKISEHCDFMGSVEYYYVYKNGALMFAENDYLEHVDSSIDNMDEFEIIGNIND